MKRLAILIFFLTVRFTFAQQGSIQGAWRGHIELGGRKLDIVVVFQKEKNGWTGLLSSQTQQLKDISISNISLLKESLSFDVPLAGGKWEGKFTNDIEKLDGHWLQGGLKAPLNFSKLTETPVVMVSERSQTPTPPYPYEAQEVHYENKRDGIRIAGTLTVPNGEGPFPAAILLTVAGANDRDQSHGAPQHKPYLVLADQLTRNGIAVLRMDDRGIGGSTGDVFSSTIENFAYDALAGFDFLKTIPKIDKTQIGFIGNSEGTLVGPLAASINGEAAFIITLGGISIPGSEVILDQSEAIGKISGLTKTEIKAIQNRTKSLFTILNSEPDNTEAKALLRAVLENDTSSRVSPKEFLIPQTIEDQLKLFATDWYRFQINYDPQHVLRKTTIPFLALHGDIDPFVDADKNLQGFAKHLTAARNSHFAVIKLKGVNHIFQDSESGSPVEYTKNENTFSTRALELIVSWLNTILKHP